MNACWRCRGRGEVESPTIGPMACPKCGGNGDRQPEPRRYRVCFFGSRDGVPDREIVKALDKLQREHPGAEVVVGGDQREDPDVDGTDALVAILARRRGLRVKEFRADWRKHGKPAGPIRNGEMAAYADMAVGFRKLGKSNGTDDCARKFEALGKPVRFAWREDWADADAEADRVEQESW